MAVLSEGGKYLLSSEPNNEDKSVLFVKLTDSALKAIEDFIKIQKKCVEAPSIRFTGNDGQIWFPTEDPAESRAFSFNLSSATDLGGPQGSFECIKQCGNRSLESLGQVTSRMSVNATDDVYARTRQKLVVAKEDNEKNCTRVLKSTTGLMIGKRVKLRGKSALQTVGSVNSHRRDPSPVHRTHLRPVTNTSSPSPIQGRLPAPSSTSPVPVKGVSPNHPLPPVASSPSPPTTIPELMKRPLKERIVHLLAVRPYKKPEIHGRLIKEGVRDKEKSQISTVLHSVANYKDNTYHLHKYIWNEIKEDWPFYSEQERQQLKRRKPQSFTPPGSDSSGSNQSPSSTQPGSSPTSGKRPAPLENDVPPKKQRISHFKKTTVSPPLSNSLSYNVIGKPDSSQPTAWPDSRTGLSERNGIDRYKPAIQRVDSSEDLKPSLNKKGFPESDIRRRTPNINAKVTSSTGERGTPTPSSSPDSIHEVPRAGQNSPPLDSDSTDFSEYLARYKPIVNSEQWSRYRADFKRQYSEYMELHDIVDKVSQRFTELEESLRTHETGTSSWEEVKTQILREYKANLNDTKFQEARRRYLYLHEKLAHIKHLINCYDRSRVQLCQS
ncbi:RNA polymerase II elongation factor ELL-like [Artemia franciscana]|uniref:OCEL domain-containing protein n=1 Tax=Artemia franciscana TaxID=6661 RepID=A0AA88H4B8_ARTSF|nr:hypothetical protein QYM36_016852 [Artemia franciscana]